VPLVLSQEDLGLRRDEIAVSKRPVLKLPSNMRRGLSLESSTLSSPSVMPPDQLLSPVVFRRSSRHSTWASDSFMMLSPVFSASAEAFTSVVYQKGPPLRADISDEDPFLLTPSPVVFDLRESARRFHPKKQGASRFIS
jgi:hypothetical protein